MGSDGAAAPTVFAIVGSRSMVISMFSLVVPAGIFPGQRITGPAVIQEYASTTMLFAGVSATVAGTGELTSQVGSYQDGR